MDQNELITLAGVFFGGLLAGAVGYFKKQRPAVTRDPVLAGIGMELGNKEQMKELIAAVNRLCDIISDKKQDEIEDRIDSLLKMLERQHPDR